MSDASSDYGNRVRHMTRSRLTEIVGEFALTPIDDDALGALWASPHFPWHRISRAFATRRAVDLAVWQGKDLAALGLLLEHATNVEIRFLEGAPAESGPLKGARTLIMLEAATNYALLTGRRRIHIEPMNSSLSRYYKSFGFRAYPLSSGSPHLWKDV